jgi:hypothetical protein
MLAPDVSALLLESQRMRRLRLVSIFRRGWMVIVVALLRQESLPEGRLIPKPWPVAPALDEADVWEEAAGRPGRLRYREMGAI